MEWNMKETIQLINFYREFECLWNYKSASYKRIDLKKNAWQQISNGCGRDIEAVKKKIKYLRNTYVTEKKKVEHSKKSGSSAESMYEPHLFYYQEFSFLDSVIVLRKTISSLETQKLKLNDLNAVEDSDLNTTLCESLDAEFEPPLSSSSSSTLFSSSTPSLIPTPSSSSASSESRKRVCRKTYKEDKFDKAVDAIVASATATEQENVFTSFGKTIALQLQQLPLAEATRTMSEIHSIVTNKILKHMSRSQNTNILKTALNDANITFEEH